MTTRVFSRRNSSIFFHLSNCPDVVTQPPASQRACRDKERIVIYGDYDVDGMTAVAILWHVLTIAGANVGFYIPHRLEEGYGINVDAIKSLVDDGAKLIVSVDCGVTAVEAAQVVRDGGAELIITDHHQAGDSLPVDTLIVHPGLGRFLSECGFVRGGGRVQAGVGDCAGVVSVGEGRRHVQNVPAGCVGIGGLGDDRRCRAAGGGEPHHRTAWLGAHSDDAVRWSAGIDRVSRPDRQQAEQLRHRVQDRTEVERGRPHGHARLGVELLTRATADRAREIALYLHDQNKTRQSTERKITTQAKEMADAAGMTKDSSRGIVLAREGWHAGVIGIVASRLVDAFSRPTVIISLDNGVGQGSARSVPNFHMTEALTHCSQHLATFGGHAQAAGLKIETDNIAAFTEQFIDHANNTLTHRDLRGQLSLDAEVAFSDLDMASTEALLGLGPFGNGNPTPRFTTDWVNLSGEPRVVGQTGTHLQATFTDGRQVLKAIAFGKGKLIDDLREHRRCRVAFEPMINDFNGRRNRRDAGRRFPIPRKLRTSDMKRFACCGRGRLFVDGHRLLDWRP